MVLYIVGAGPGSPDFVTPAAQKAVKKSDLIRTLAREDLPEPEPPTMSENSPSPMDRFTSFRAGLVASG